MPSLLPRPETLLRWHRDLVRRRWAAFPRRPPRPHPARDPERRECVLRLARENPRWGYRRIQGEALKLGFRISHMGLAKILRSQRIPPAPRRSQTTWRQFVRQHATQMLAIDFFTVETAWLQRLHVLFFIEIAGRKVHLGGITASPTGEWVAQQARNLAWKFQDGALRARYLLRGRDSKFSAVFDQVFRSEGVEVVRLPFRAPRSKDQASDCTPSAHFDGNDGARRWRRCQWYLPGGRSPGCSKSRSPLSLKACARRRPSRSQAFAV